MQGHGRGRRKGPGAARITIAVVLALLWHGVVLTGLELMGAFSHFTPTALQLVQSSEATRQNEPEQPLEIESLVESLEHPPELTEAEKKEKEEEERKDQTGQVVDVAKPAVEQRPDDARFLAEYDSRVSRETKGAVGKGQAGAPQPAAPAQPPSPPSAAQPPSPAGGPKSQALAMRGPLGTKVPGTSSPASEVQTIGPDGDLAHRAGAGPVRPPEVPGGGSLPGSETRPTPNLVPSQSMLEHALGMGSGSPDFLEDMEEADSTGLNAKKWKFAAFINRVKRAVAEEWHPDELLSRHDPSGHIYGANDRTTVLKVQLRPDGGIADLQVSRPSGVDFLDDEAMSAFRRAQPFDNPPAGMADSDGFIRFKFGFIVQLSGRTSFKVYKYRE